MLKISLQLSNSFYLKMEKNGKLSVDSCDEIAIDKETIDYISFNCCNFICC